MRFRRVVLAAAAAEVILRDAGVRMKGVWQLFFLWKWVLEVLVLDFAIW